MHIGLSYKQLIYYVYLGNFQRVCIIWEKSSDILSNVSFYATVVDRWQCNVGWYMFDTSEGLAPILIALDHSCILVWFTYCCRLWLHHFLMRLINLVHKIHDIWWHLLDITYRLMVIERYSQYLTDTWSNNISVINGRNHLFANLWPDTFFITWIN